MEIVSMLASKACICVWLHKQCELSYFHSVKLFSGTFKLPRKLSSAKLKTFDNHEVPVQPQQLLFDLAVALGGDCMHSKSVSKDKCMF